MTEQLTVRQRIQAENEVIEAVRRRQREIISTEPPTFKHLPLEMANMYGNARYVLVYADGSLPEYVYPLTQRPAALRAARRAGWHIWDTRKDVVLDGEGKTVYRRQPRDAL